jgi:hypothetical protein
VVLLFFSPMNSDRSRFNSDSEQIAKCVRTLEYNAIVFLLLQFLRDQLRAE